MTTNKFGLNRNIPLGVKREVRQACGYGCVVCGNAICQYEHIDPPFSETKEHDPKNIALLCGSCHDKVTKGRWSKEKVIHARKNPKAKELGFSNFSLDIKKGEKFVIKVGNTEFLNLENIIQIDGEILLRVKPPEKENSPPQITTKFFDRENNEIASIIDNEWFGTTDTFGIETKGKSITIRSDDRKIDLVVTVNPPTELIIDRLNLQFNGKTIIGSKDKGFEVVSKNAAVKIPLDEVRVEKAPHWLSITDEKISLGKDTVIDFISSDGDKSKLPGTYEIKGAGLEFVVPEADGIPPPPGWKSGDKIMKVSSKSKGGGIGIKFDIPPEKRGIPNKPTLPGAKPYMRPKRKIGRNEPCPCGSGKKYKKCHGRT